MCNVFLSFSTIFSGALDVEEGRMMQLEFKQVDVTNPQELREAPELIGAHRVERDAGKMTLCMQVLFR